MLKNWIAAIVVSLGVVCSSSDAHAVLVGGENYEKFLSLKADSDAFLGYWRKMNKFYSYTAGDYGPGDIGVTETYIDSSLANYDVAALATMGTTKSQFGAVNSEVLSLYDDSGNNLLTANIKGEGDFYLLGLNGPAGQFKISGLFNVASGILFDNKLITGTIYAILDFDSVVNHSNKDFYSSNGTINLYWKGPGPGTSVPEPASMFLLGSGLIGVFSRKRKVLH